jgi:adenylate cyclase
MTRISERTVLFADLRGSTSLYETLGNAEATSVVTHTVTMMARTVPKCDGQLIKTLGDGLMAVFDSSEGGLKSAGQMHDERPVALPGRCRGTCMSTHRCVRGVTKSARRRRPWNGPP